MSEDRDLDGFEEWQVWAVENLDHDADQIEEAWQAATRRQRERDAKVAERFIVEGMTCTDTRIIHTNGAATQIAAEIRADK